MIVNSCPKSPSPFRGFDLALSLVVCRSACDRRLETQCFTFGDVIEVCGLAVAVPEGVLVEVKQPKGGWVFQRHGDQTILEEVEALKAS